MFYVILVLKPTPARVCFLCFVCSRSFYISFLLWWFWMCYILHALSCISYVFRPRHHRLVLSDIYYGDLCFVFCMWCDDIEKNWTGGVWPGWWVVC